MKKILIIIVMMFFTIEVKCQDLYIDPVTSAALIGYGIQLKDAQDKTNEEVTKLKKAQEFVTTQMVYANKIQDKIYKGLREVSGTISNGIQLKEIYTDMTDTYKYIGQVKALVAKHPQYAIFGAKTSQKTYQQLLKIESEAQDIIQDSSTNLATAGDRKMLLLNISQNVKALKIWVLQIKLDLERAERLGFWKSINPFQGYMNTDMDIVKNIMWQYKNRF